MKKLLLLFVFLIFFAGSSQAYTEESTLLNQNGIQSEINQLGFKILNANKIEKRVIFVYNEKEKSKLLKDSKSILKREVVIYGDIYKSIETEDELAAYIAREIPLAVRSYDGIAGGWLSSVKMKAAPKKYEIICDKLAVDYMVKAGYNPLALIVHINKIYPQTRQDKISIHNLTSKRLANIYERIYIQYPKFLVDNKYINNPYYQNFLLTSIENRKKVMEISKNPKQAKDLKYE